MNLELECTYCGHIWQLKVYSQNNIESRCINGNCKETKIKIKDLNRDKVDYYKGCPPFPPRNDWQGGYF